MMNDVLLSYDEFLDRFSTEEACIDYLYQAKWPNGFVCPDCRHRHAYQISTRRLPLFECSHCRHQTSLISGTVVEGSHTELTKWFQAFYFFSCPGGISARRLSEKIEVTYKTAWLILHKIRKAISEEDAFCPLSGSVFVNPAIYGPRPRSIRSLEKSRTIYVGSSINEENEPSYIKIKTISKKMVDRHGLFNILRKIGKQSFIDEHIDSNPTQLDFSHWYKFKNKAIYFVLLEAKRWIAHTFHGLSWRHLQAYFNEHCFRVNMKWNKKPVFENLVRCCTQSRGVTYADLTSHS